MSPAIWCEFVAILGPSGSGKTTLLNIIGGLDRYDSGDLIINGISTKRYKDKDWDSYRNHTIGFVFQSYNLIPHQTVLANVELALTISGISRSERRRRAEEALTKVGLGEQLHKKPNQMSGGQMQRVAIARALVNDPDILLADEPTGALDSDTSVQVMDMLAEVAKDRLVVMVTHNPELAEQYASRIVRVKDGRILSDSDPYEVSEKESRGAVHRNMGRSSMSIGTALGLSFNNLLTKKGRTLVTAFAGSIGIIGIALILSLSNGVNTYIDNIQKDAMESYPIEIDQQAFDLTGFMESARNARDGAMTEHDTDAIYADNSTIEMQSFLRTSDNNLSAFRDYLESDGCELKNYVGDNGIVYTYDTEFGLYTYDPEDVFVNTDGSDLSGGIAAQGMALMMGRGTLGNTEQMLAGTDADMVSDTIRDNYDLLYGRYPQAYDEAVLVLNWNNTLSVTTLYQLGILPASEYDAIQTLLDQNEDVSLKNQKFSYADVCSKTFYIIPQCDRYEKNEDGTFSDISQNKSKLEALAKDAVQLKITGVIKPNADTDTLFITKPIAYTQALTDWLIDYTESSEVVRAQKQKPDFNILTGLDFQTSDRSQKISSAKQYISNLEIPEKAALYQTLLMTGKIDPKEEDPTEASGSAEVEDNGFTPLAARQQGRIKRLAAVTLEADPVETQPTTAETTVSDSPVINVMMDLSITTLPEKTIYNAGEEMDLTGGMIHEKMIVLHEDGTTEVNEADVEMTDESYTLDASLFNNTRQGIYPVAVVKHYTDEATGQEYTGNALFYVLVIGSVQETTEVTETTAPTESAPIFTMPTDMTLPTDFTMPTLPEGLTPEAIQEYLRALIPQTDPTESPIQPGSLFPNFSGMSADQLAALYAAMQGGSGTGTVTPSQDLAALYAAMQGAGGSTALPGSFSIPSATGGGSQDLASLYAALQGGGSQQDLASMYAAMQGGNASQQDLAGMYAALQGTTDPTEPGTGSGQQDLASLYASMMGGSGDLDFSNLSQEDMAALFAAQQDAMNMTAEDFEKFFSMSGKSEAELASLLDAYMKDPVDEVMTYIYDRYIASGSYEENLKTFGAVDRTAPSSIAIYAGSFEDKDSIAECIKAYNEDASEEDQITYTDYTALLMSSITTIINVISYVLIAFVAVSLIVSSIMIGIITYISVLERTKEIGILRAIGASKRNISQVFNAETFIIGLCSGIIGIGVTLLLLIPGNLVIHKLADSNSVSAILPPAGAVILVILSVVLTLIGGLIPSQKAAKKDPVTALRTE